MAEALPEYPDSDFSEDDQSPLEVSFNKASDHVRKITTKLNNNQLLELYGLFKQSTEGKCNIPRPGWLDGKGRKKWEAWRSLVDMPSDEAKQKYIDLVQKYDPECELVEEAGPKQQWVAVSSLQRSPEPDLSHDELSLLDAAREDMGELVSKLISKNPAIKAQRDKDGLTALHWAADRNATSALEAAIQSGCDINAMDNSGQTALHYAASCGHVNSTQILMKAGAKLFKDEDDCSPLDLAADEEIRNILSA
ncbi:acyl-CoA-binding domain-containing protein 6 [Pieris napi]|uniref:acyl-CoA-binding domain-containing protein 6 n=1 Tax=Pieris napi TaxID=78633 RepID=UPI001FBA5CF7|nr:acyl-CoA-binding domain-containing protein 6 [Pieris napi]